MVEPFSARELLVWTEGGWRKSRDVVMEEGRVWEEIGDEGCPRERESRWDGVGVSGVGMVDGVWKRRGGKERAKKGKKEGRKSVNRATCPLNPPYLADIPQAFSEDVRIPYSKEATFVLRSHDEEMSSDLLIFAKLKDHSSV